MRAPRNSSVDLLQRRVVEDQPPLAAVLEAHRHDTVAADRRDDALAECLVADRVAGEERGMLARRELGRDVAPAVVPPRGSEPFALDAVLGQLVEEARGQVVRATAEERA